ncbi:sulfurtransferase [Luteimonas sp. SJ-92]|uniref:Sulfurtransferase n=1 Tax=Luteimonas salinisoli TaxID=2752307 RepID=A0A853JDH8_9GAMM|nr:sulfurtransferase [Luteimonas salinisoli]NZA27366.1 sulfurtransferase [Luteimonas salinisoli]
MLTNVAAYRFAPIADPPALAARVRDWAGGEGLRGTVLVAEEGINLFLAGADAAVAAFMCRLRAEPGLDRLQAKYSYSRAQPFARLKVKRKQEIISFRRAGGAPLARRAPTVDPADLARWIANGADDGGRRLVLLDTRNREEVGYGTFDGALALPIDNFTELPGALGPHRDALADATVVSFCTGGIRCEKAALWMRDAGMDNVLQLEGGILGYFEQVGGFGYRGECFVFDGRVALDPALRPRVDAAPALEEAA